MRLLLDTHIALWAITDNPKLSIQALSLIQDPANEILLSVVSLWEIAIKHPLSRKGSGAMPLSGAEAWVRFEAAGYPLLDINPTHILELELLPPLHGDPFDRLLVAQARSENLKLLTRDAALLGYGEEVIRV